MVAKETFIPILKGICKKVLVHRKFSPKTFGTNDSRYCYSVWMRHFIFAHQAGFRIKNASVAELGPGDSLGMGIAALICGADRYYAMDVFKYWNIEENLHMFDLIVDLFQKRSPIPDQNEFPKVFPLLDNYQFPYHILSDAWMVEMLAPERLQKLRGEIQKLDSGHNQHIFYYIPWTDKEKIQTGTIDYFFSQAVLQYVDDLQEAYRKFNKWLKIGGFMTHCIDFSAHGITKTWNGHWTFSLFNWKLTHGNNQILLNRASKSMHMRILHNHEFEIETCKDKIRNDGFKPHDFHKEFKVLSEIDATIFASFFVARKCNDIGLTPIFIKSQNSKPIEQEFIY